MGHLVIYVHDLRTSGVVRDSLKLAAHCSGHHRVTLIAGHGGGFFETEAGDAGCEIVCLRAESSGSGGRLLAVLPLRRWLRKQAACVLISMGNMGHSTPWLACRGLTHVRRIYRISNEVTREDGLRGRVRSLWMKLLINDAERLPLVGHALATNPLFANAMAKGIAVEVASGVDSTRAAELAHEPVPHPWFEDDIPVVLAIGRLRPQKNFGLLIDGVALLHRKQRVRLIIIGGGSPRERQELIDHATRAGLGEDCLFAGETHNVFCWLIRAQVFVLPSRWEGSSLALLEAMAVGTPVVASVLAGDAAWVLDGGRYGRLFDGQSPESLAEAMALQLSDEVVVPADRALRYPEPWEIYRRMIEKVMTRS
jgi:glycosyltransferase involved in cell wall biosynthesis